MQGVLTKLVELEAGSDVWVNREDVIVIKAVDGATTIFMRRDLQLVVEGTPKEAVEALMLGPYTLVA